MNLNISALGRMLLYKHLFLNTDHKEGYVFTSLCLLGISGAMSLPSHWSHVISGGREFLVPDPFWGVGYEGWVSKEGLG